MDAFRKIAEERLAELKSVFIFAETTIDLQ